MHSPAPPSLLVLETYDPARRGLAELLRECGYSVAEARDVAEGLRAARAAPPVLVILDLWPFPESLETVERLRSAVPTGSAAVLALADTGLPDLRRQALAAGCHAFLEKPCPPDRLLAAVRRMAGPPGGPGSGR